MTLSAQDRTNITDLISLHGHHLDNGEIDRMHELFTPDATYDLSDFGGSETQGLPEMRAAMIALGDDNPVGHHVTNVVITEVDGRHVNVLSKGIGVMPDGTCGSVTYQDTIVSTQDGWRIRHRAVRKQRTPLGGAHRRG